MCCCYSKISKGHYKRLDNFDIQSQRQGTTWKFEAKFLLEYNIQNLCKCAPTLTTSNSYGHD